MAEEQGKTTLPTIPIATSETYLYSSYECSESQKPTRKKVESTEVGDDDSKYSHGLKLALVAVALVLSIFLVSLDMVGFLS